jgi:YidC/Oxa1 family membrane protein insertase
MQDQNNLFFAIMLSIVILISWQYFFAGSFSGRQAARKISPPGSIGAGTPRAPGFESRQTALPATQPLARQAALARSPRIILSTPRLKGSIALTGGRIDDLSLAQYRETSDPQSPAVELLSPSGSPHPFYAEFGWISASGMNVKVPAADTVWNQVGSGGLSLGHPVALIWRNDQGLEFRRTITVDEKYLFTVRDEVANNGQSQVDLASYALVARHNPPAASGSALLHEGAIGVLGDRALQEISYKALDDNKRLAFIAENTWLGFTDKYWAAILIPDGSAPLQAEFSASPLGALKTYQVDTVQETQTIAPGGTGHAETRLFAGAKEVEIVDGYDRTLHLDRFDRLIDWGWFRFLTKPMFMLIDGIFRLVGNFGVAILIVTLMLKVAFFPLANKAYASTAKMKALQPQIQAIRERFADDKVKQQQTIIELYRKERINPIAGCIPTLIQVPLFFSLYKVLFITIEMRQAPFFGWIKDLSAPDPTSLFNLFGLIPYNPLSLPIIGGFLVLGAWPLLMGLTQWVQMKLTPASPDPTQAAIMNWMPILFTFMLAGFPAGLVIYWTWNNSLSVLQQIIVMRRNGVRIGLLDDLRTMFLKK